MKLFQTIKEFVGENNELVESTDIAIKERLTSPFYGYFICSWLLFNWQIIYVAFFVSQDNILTKTGLLRYQYLQQSFPILWSWGFFLEFLIYPLLATALFFWVFPLVTRIYYRKSLKNQKALRRIDIEENLQISKEEKKLVKEETDLIKTKSEQEKQKKKVEKETPEILWQKEFEDFKGHPSYINFSQLKNVIYNNSGKTHKWNGASYVRLINTDVLATAHTKNLILINGKEYSDERIELTEKGRFFMSKYLEINPI